MPGIRCGRERRAGARLAPADLRRADTRMRFSVVIPTYQRRSLIVRTVRAFRPRKVATSSWWSWWTAPRRARADAPGFAQPFPLTVIEQPNGGRAAAVNVGAAAATGKLLLFLDDDMHVAHDLLSEHERSRSAGADIVLGHVPLDPDSPPARSPR